jgi:hypothetical protein
MLSKRTQTLLGLMDFAFVVTLVGMTLASGVPPARWPLKYRIVEFLILPCFALSFLYRVVAQLPPILFRSIRAMMIFIVGLAVLMGWLSVIARTLGPQAVIPAVVVALIMCPGLVREWVERPPAKRLTVGRYYAWRLRRFGRKAIPRWGGDKRR